MRHSTVEDLRILFDQSIPAATIAEPLASFDQDRAANDLLEYMHSRGFDLVGLRVDGLTVGYVTAVDLSAGKSPRDCVLAIQEDESLSERDALLTAVGILKKNDRAFVVAFGQAVGIVTWADLSKPPVRMWLFNLVGLLEMRLLGLIRQYYPGDAWRDFVGASQLSKAEGLLKKRCRKNQDLDLLGCLELIDVNRIVLEIPPIVHAINAHVRDVKDFLRVTRQLRNDLAHSQEILTGNWPATVALAEQIEAVLAALEDLEASACQPVCFADE